MSTRSWSSSFSNSSKNLRFLRTYRETKPRDSVGQEEVSFGQAVDTQMSSGLSEGGVLVGPDKGFPHFLQMPFFDSALFSIQRGRMSERRHGFRNVSARGKRQCRQWVLAHEKMTRNNYVFRVNRFGENAR